MPSRPLVRAAFVAALAMPGLCTGGLAQPLITSGIGLQSCEKLGPALKPSEGLNHPPNYLLFYWVQGYISAANFHLLNEHSNYIDMSKVDEQTILKLVFDFCKANPGKKPISAIDKFIRDAEKVEAEKKDVFDPWEQ